MIAKKAGNTKATILAETLSEAISQYLENAKSPSRKVNEIDNRMSTFYLAMVWAQTLAAQDKDTSLQAAFVNTAKALEENETEINRQMLAAQGQPVDIGGYYLPDPELTAKQMRPSKTFNNIIDAM